MRVQGQDGPWAVLLPGLGLSSEVWDPVADDLARDHRVLRYDRPGLGMATVGRARTPHLHDEVAHLRRVVDDAADAPVWLVAHSMSSFLAEAFWRSDPHRVAGVVTVDGSVEESPRRRWAVENEARLVGASVLGRLPLVGRRLRSTLLEDAAYLRMATELLALRRALPLPRVPVVLVVAARPWVPGSRRWVRRQRHLARRYRVEMAREASPPTGAPGGLPRVRVVVMTDSGHLVMRDQPARLAALVRASSRRSRLS